MRELIREVLQGNARLSVPAADIGVDDDLYQLGLTSHASVNVMLALEEAFDVEFPNRMLRKSTFQSISSIEGALDELEAEAPAR